MDLSIIILNYDCLAHTRRCLASISKFPPNIDYEILLINNGSKRDRAEQLHGLHPKARVFDIPVNLGFGRANNLGMEVARGRYFLLLNSDTYFMDDSLQRAFEFAESERAFDIFTCRQLSPDGETEFSTNRIGKNPVWEAVYEVLQENPVIERLRPTFFGFAPPHSEQVGLVGAFLFLKREVFERTGGFDPDFFLYLEETEWFCNRIYPAGYKVGIHDELKVVHVGGGSQTNASRFAQARLSTFLYYYKRSPLGFAAACITQGFNLLVRFILTPFVPWAYRFNARFLMETTALLFRVLVEVPRYRNSFAARPVPLMLPKYREAFEPDLVPDKLTETRF